MRISTLTARRRRGSGSGGCLRGLVGRDARLQLLEPAEVGNGCSSRLRLAPRRCGGWCPLPQRFGGCATTDTHSYHARVDPHCGLGGHPRGTADARLIYRCREHVVRAEPDTKRPCALSPGGLPGPPRGLKICHQRPPKGVSKRADPRRGRRGSPTQRLALGVGNRAFEVRCPPGHRDIDFKLHGTPVASRKLRQYRW